MPAARRALLALVLACAAPPARAQRRGGAAAAIQEARDLLAREQPAAALARVERALATLRGATEPEQVALRLEAARIAAIAGEPDRARSHLVAAERIATGPAFRNEPLLTAQLRREFARVREQLGDMAAAERLLTLALPPLERADAMAAADVVNARGAARMELLRLVEAVADFERSLALLRRAGRMSGDPAVAVLTNLAIARADMGEIAPALEAAGLARQAAGAEPRLRRAADLGEAEARLRAADTTAADALLERIAADSPPTDPLRGHALLALARARIDRGHLAEALQDATVAMESYRQSLGERHPAFGRALHALGTARSELGDAVGAAGVLARASEVLQAALGTSSAQFHATEVERGVIDLGGGAPERAERRARAALATYATDPPPDRRPEGLATVLLGLAAEAQGRADEAATLFRRGQAAIEQARGPDSPDLGFSLVRLGRLLTRIGRLTEAAAPLDRAIAIYARVGGAGSVRLADAVTARAELRARQGHRQGALEDTRRGLAVLRERVGAAEAIGAVQETQRRGARQLFAAQAQLLLDLGPADPAARDDAFLATQEALASRAGEALRRAAVRRSAGTGALPRLLRTQLEAQDAQRQAEAQVLATAIRPASAEATRSAAARRDAAAARFADATAALARDFPDFAGFIAPRPASLEQVQRTLEPDEALLAPLATEDGLLVWVVRRNALRALKDPMRADELAAHVQTLRSGLDVGLGQDIAPFSFLSAQAVHAALLGRAEEVGLLEGVRHLLLIPDGALQQLPPHVLVDAAGSWLVERHAVTIAPSVAAMLAARTSGPARSAARFAFLGIGDPVFSAFAMPARPGSRGPSPDLRSRLADLSRLADTADELRRIARILGAQDSRLLLREDASERGLLSARPEQYRVLVLASHAVMAGELPGLAEPAVVLTADDDDAPMDGLLTASDVAALELNADLVLVSACNTAAPDGGPYAEGLSGLARSFLHAGARALLVSHWYVNSTATVELTTGFVAALQAAPHRRPAEALREGMHRMLTGERRALHHPAFWAPFVVVGG